MGARWINDFGHGRYDGRRTYGDQQGLLFPRWGIYSPDGVVLASDAVPGDVRLANAMLAVENRVAIEAGEPSLFPGAQDEPDVKAESFRLGPISLSSTYAGRANESPARRFPTVARMLRRFMPGGGRKAVLA